jgi:hypothetical protein
MSSDNRWPGVPRDTGNVLDGTALGALFAGTGAAAGFSIDYECVPQAIVDLQEAARFIRKQAETARSLADINTSPPGTDGISQNAVTQIGKWAAEEDGINNLHATLVAGAKQLEDLAQKLGADLKTYLQVEELNLPKTASPGLPQSSPGRPR